MGGFGLSYKVGYYKTKINNEEHAKALVNYMTNISVIHNQHVKIYLPSIYIYNVTCTCKISTDNIAVGNEI